MTIAGFGYIVGMLLSCGASVLGVMIWQMITDRMQDRRSARYMVILRRVQGSPDFRHYLDAAGWR